MTDWPVRTLGEVCEVVNGATPDTKVKEYWGGSHAWITPAEMGNLDSPFLSKSRRTLSDEGLASCSAALVPPKTVILSSRAPIGHVVINEIPMATNQGCKSLIPREGLHFNFLYYYLKANVELLDSLGTGTTFKELSGTQLKTVGIPLPPLEEQKRIVALLDAATERVAELTACYEQARTHANNLFTSALRDALEGNPDWPVKTLGEVATFHNGRAYKQQELLDKGKYRVLRVGNFFSSKNWYWSDLELDEHKYCDKGDLLYAWSASFGPRIWGEEKVIYHYHIWKVEEDSQQIDRQFLKYWLEEDVERIKSASGTGTTMMHVSKGSIEARSISLPPLEEQMRVVSRLDLMRTKTSEMVAAYDAKLTAAKNLRQSILEAAFAGDL